MKRNIELYDIQAMLLFLIEQGHQGQNIGAEIEATRRALAVALAQPFSRGPGARFAYDDSAKEGIMDFGPTSPRANPWPMYDFMAPHPIGAGSPVMIRFSADTFLTDISHPKSPLSDVVARFFQGCPAVSRQVKNKPTSGQPM